MKGAEPEWTSVVSDETTSSDVNPLMRIYQDFNAYHASAQE